LEEFQQKAVIGKQNDQGNHGNLIQEVPVVPMLKRHQVQVLLDAGHSQSEVRDFSGLSLRTIRRITKEPSVEQVDDAIEREKRHIGRPRIAETYREYVKTELEKEPELLSVEILRRAKLKGYSGGKSAMYELTRELRPRPVKVGMRFEGVAGEFSQHDFGQIRIRYLSNSEEEGIHFFASRLKWSRWAIVSFVEDESAETLIRTLADHFMAFGGVPLCAVFDRPKTVALRWGKDGTVTEWNPLFAFAAMELGFTAEVCWPYQPQQKGSVENLVGWVKGSFFKQRRFNDKADLQTQLTEWLIEANQTRPSRATGEIPVERLKEDRSRLRVPRCTPDKLALRVPIQVGPTAEVIHEGRAYSMDPEAAGIPGTLYLYRDRVRIVAGRFEAIHDRIFISGGVSRLPEHRAAHLAAVSGKRGKRYLKRQQLFELGEEAVSFLTEVVHRRPFAWSKEVDELHQILQGVGAERMHRAFRAAVQSSCYDVRFIAQCLGWNGGPGNTITSHQEAHP
jgi:transposase